MQLLYSDLSTSDSGAIAAKLEENTIPYEVSPDGGRIIVLKPMSERARLLLAEAGLPNGGSLGYEIFDKDAGFGTTNFVQNVKQVRALQGELGRTISSLDAVRSARVYLSYRNANYSAVIAVHQALVFIWFKARITDSKRADYRHSIACCRRSARPYRL